MEQAGYGYDLAITHHSTKDVAATYPFSSLLGESLIHGQDDRKFVLSPQASEVQGSS